MSLLFLGLGNIFLFPSANDESIFHRNYIHMKLGSFVLPNQSELTDESYMIAVNASQDSIEIVVRHPAGGFYAVQTLMSLLWSTSPDEQQRYFPEITIKDSPRYCFIYSV